MVSNPGDDEHPHWCPVASSGDREEASVKGSDRSNPVGAIPESMRRRAMALGLYADNIPLDAFQTAVEQPYHIRQIAFPPNGGWFINDEGIYRYRGLASDVVAKIKELGSFSGDSITEVAFSPDGGWVVVNQYAQFFGNNIPEALVKKLSDIRENRNLYGAHDLVYSIAFAPNGGWVVVFGDFGGEGRKVEARHLPVDAANTIRELMREQRRIYQVAFSPEGGWVVIFDKNSFRMNGIPKEMLDALWSLNKNGKRIRRVAFSPSGG